MKADQPSATAHLIACSIVFLAKDPTFGPLVPPQAAEASAWFMEAYSPRAKLLQRCMDNRLFRRSVRLIEQLTIPGILLHYVLRKRYLEQIVRNCLREGFRQVVILGAGFDTLALRLHQEFAQVRFTEVDHPATQRLKTQVLANRQVRLPNVSFIRMDFSRQTLAESLLSSPHYCPTALTLFVAEGVLMYFRVEEVRGIFRFIGEHAGARSRFAFTFLEPQADGAINFRNSSKAVNFWLRLRSEPFRWGINREELPVFLKTNGVSLNDLATHETLRACYLTGARFTERLAEGEHICVVSALEAKSCS